MRIALNGWFWGREATGSGQYLQHLLERLPQVEPTASWVLITAGSPERAPPRPWQTVAAAPPPGLPGRNLEKVWFEQVGFPLACRRLGIDLAHVPYWGSPWWSPCPVVVTIHDIIPRVLPAYRGGPPQRLYTWLVGRTARRAQTVLTDSQASARDVVNFLRVPAARVRVTALAAPAHYRRVSDLQTLQAVRVRYGLPRRFVLYMGGFDARKNVGFLLQAFARAAQRPEFPDDVMLVIAGRLPLQDNSFTPDPRRAAAALRVASRVIFPGWIAEVDKPALYSLADVVVYPSSYEGFGLPVLEAMACGFESMPPGTAPAAPESGNLYEVPDRG